MPSLTPAERPILSASADVDPLHSARGVIYEVGLAIVFFWLPLAVALFVILSLL